MNQRILRQLSLRESEATAFDHWLALGYLGFIVLIELFTVEIVSPLLSVLAFGYFAHRMRPRNTLLWTSLYTAVSGFFLFDPTISLVRPDMAFTTETACIRFGTLLLAAFGAVLLSRHRNRVAESFLQTLTILEKLPAPVVLSDSAGCIVFMNDDALNLLDIDSAEAIGASYFTFLAEGERGRTVQKYLDMVDAPNCRAWSISVQLKKPVPRMISASIVSIEANHTKLLATVLRPQNGHSKSDHGETQAS